ncbi:MAG: hypothetical protein WA990_03545 [Rubrobacteraceae bacterium]
MSGAGNEPVSRELRTAHLLRIQGYMTMAILSMWQASPRAPAIIGMAQASIKGEGPGGHEEEALETLRSLLEEAVEYYEKGDFPPAMSRMRVANDLVSLYAIRLAGE